MTKKYFNFHRHNMQLSASELAIVNLFPEEAEEIHPAGGALFSIGIHPWKLDAATADNELQMISNASFNPAIIAIGECGLDRHCNTSFELQMRLFISQVEIAESAGKPLIIHCVRAFPELISIKKKRSSGIPWIVHGFRNKKSIADELLQHGMHLSFGSHLRNSQTLREVLSGIPSDRFFLETDDSDVSIEDVYRQAAGVRGIGIDELCDQQLLNAEKILGPVAKLAFYRIP